MNQSQKQRPAKMVKNLKDCLQKCKMRCSHHIVDAERDRIHREYWELPRFQKKHFINLYTTATPRTFAPHIFSRKKVNYDYFLSNDSGEKVKVCKSFFLGTLDIGAQQVYNLHNQKDKFTGMPKPDGRGKQTKSRIDPADKQLLLDHIRSFPAFESHLPGDSSKFGHHV